MRKSILIIVIFMILLLPNNLFSEEQENVYARSVPIVKILQHSLGYKIYYITSADELAYFYAPMQWFTQAGGKGTIVWGRTSEFPYFSIFWVDGEFSHIKLFLKEDLRDATWGVLEATDSQVRDKFNVEAPDFVD
jgi:hypothetical protein